MTNSTLTPTLPVNGTDDMDDMPYELRDDVCPYCDGDGGDPLNDYVLPCPHCGGEG